MTKKYVKFIKRYTFEFWVKDKVYELVTDRYDPRVAHYNITQNDWDAMFYVVDEQGRTNGWLKEFFEFWVPKKSPIKNKSVTFIETGKYNPTSTACWDIDIRSVGKSSLGDLCVHLNFEEGLLKAKDLKEISNFLFDLAIALENMKEEN